MKMPLLYEEDAIRETVDEFRGYHCSPRIGQGEFRDMKNMTGEDYPVLRPRPRRSTFAADVQPGGMTTVDGKLVYVDGSCLCFGPERIEMGLKEGQKQLVAMGKRLIILPDKKYFDCGTRTSGDIEARYILPEEEDVDFRVCRVQVGNTQFAPDSDTEPENPQDQQQWIDTSTVPHSLKQYSASAGKWVEVAASGILITALFLGSDFNTYDGVTIGGIPADGPADLNGGSVILDSGNNYIVVAGTLRECMRLSGSTCRLTVTRTMPDMDYVIEAGNRLWGCRYDGILNEIYASKLGDFKNWSCYMSLSTDSYTASCGTEGPFTGAVNFGGQPVFFKENHIHRVYGSYPANFQIQDLVCPGVQLGSGKSLAVLNGVLHYKGIHGVYAWDGSFPTMVSQALGGVRYEDAVAGAVDDRYYISMKQADTDQYSLFVYDSAKGMWHREDNLRVQDFVAYGTLAQLLAVCPEERAILSMFEISDEEFGREGPVKWMVQTGEMGLADPDMRYISRLSVRIAMEAGASVRFYARYDHGKVWECLGSIRSASMRSFLLPIRPKRCSFLELRIEGEGMVRIYAITKTIEKGSDLP
jgi:hypothetical protein